MPNSQPNRTFKFLTRVAASKALVSSNCVTTTSQNCRKNAIATTTKLPQTQRIIDEHVGKLACCDCGSLCKSSMSKLLGKSPGCGGCCNK